MKRSLAFILALVLLLGMVPVHALASKNEANPWEGRSTVFVGDSITAGSGTTKIYYEYLKDTFGFGSVTAMGVGGSCFSAASDYGQSTDPLIGRYQNIPSADLIVIFMGTNDYGHETPLGTMEDTQDGTFYGALNVIIPELVAKHTSSKLVFVTPLHRYGFGTSKILGTPFTSDDVANGVGTTLGDYVDALKTVCANNGVSVIDLYEECTLDPADTETRTNYMPDGLHPNAAGHEVIAGIMESHIRGFEPAEQEPVELTEMVYGNKFAPGNDQTYRASSRINYYLKAGTVITLKDSAAMQWACAKTSDEVSTNNLGYFPDGAWSDKETAVVEADGWVGFVFKYRDTTKVFDLSKPLSDYITIEEPHTHSYTPTVTAPTCTEKGCTTYTCDCGNSYVDDYVAATGHTYKNGVCTGCGAAQWDTDGDGTLEILAIGNSFSVDALEYAYQIGQSLGIEKIVIGNLYIGGCTLATHAANAAGDLGKYTYYYNDNSTWTSTGSYKISTALESRSWDYVSMQQGSPVSGVESSYNEDLTNLIAYVKERSDAKLVWHMTWAYQQNSTHSAFPTYGKDQMTMYNAIVSTVQNKIVTNENFDLIVPNGTAVQNSRTSLLGDTTTRDGYHMSKDYGRYLTGLLFMKTVTGLSVDNISYAPSGVDAEEKAIAIESVNNAAADPFAVTDSIHVAEIPEEGYILLQSALYPGAYWNSKDNNGKHSTLISDASNSHQFYATIRFTREMLPVGSIIVLADGWQYRPEGWVTDTVHTTRPDTTTASYVVVTEEWWGNYTIRSFNISKVGLPSLTKVTEEEVRAAFQIYVPEESHSHTYENGVCTLCGTVADGAVWQIVVNDKVVGAYADLQKAVDACENGGTICLTADHSVVSGAVLEKNITIDGGNHTVDISGCGNAFLTVAEGAEVTIRDLKLDGGAAGFEVDYDAVTYTNYAIPLKAGSLDNDPKASQSAIISSGSLICENVDISNRYTASFGGAMQILAGSTQLTDCDFTHNYGTSKGGALFIGSNLGSRTDYPVEQVTITGCTFTENYTGHGGAIYAYNMTEMVIEASDFTGNTANGGKGGAIDLFSETTKPTAAMALGLDFMQTTIRDCAFRGNWAGNDGFAIQSYDSDLYIYDSEFTENVGVHPTSSVGTVSIEAYRHADDSQRIYTLMGGCLFEGNQGPCAVYGDHSSIADLDITDCVFRNNKGNMSLLLYSSLSNIRNCQFIGETMAVGVVDARIYENYAVAPLLTMTDITFTDCDTPAEILTRKQNHNTELNDYPVVLQGTTNGDIAIWDGCQVTVLGTHTGNVQLDHGTERSSLVLGSEGSLRGIVLIAQPESVEQEVGKKFAITAKAEGEGLSYQWFYKDSGMKNFGVSSNKTSSYAYTMQSYMHNRQVYCVITDAYGNQVTTETATITRPALALQILEQPKDVQVKLGEKFSISPKVQGDGLTYQWYYKESYQKNFSLSSNKTSAYAYTMASYMNGRSVYCVITDKYGNSVTTDVATISLPHVELKILTQPTNVVAAKGEQFSVKPVVQGDGLTYQWYYKESYQKNFSVSSNKTSAYAYAMQSYMNGRSVYCVITDQYGNQVTTDVVTLFVTK